METTPDRINILGMLPDELVPLLPDGHAQAYRARQILHWIYARGCTDFSAMTELPQDLRRLAAERYTAGVLTPERIAVSEDGDATKFLWRLPDDRMVESVHLVLATRETFCISSQVGCAYQCTFCATGRMGFHRHLTSAEIVEQVYHLRERLRGTDRVPPSYNVVFMGMGEPLHNYRHVVDAIRRLVHPSGLNLSERRITISTVGLATRMRWLAQEGLKIGLALSLNATTDEVRHQTMPVTKRYPIAEIIDAAREFAHNTGRRVTLEYVLLKGVNDSLEDAERLRRIARSLPSKINVIPFNPVAGTDLERPSEAWIERFLESLMKGDAPAVTCRTTRGLDIAAACGQLAVEV